MPLAASTSWSRETVRYCVGAPDCEPEIDNIVCRHCRPRRHVTHTHKRTACQVRSKIGAGLAKSRSPPTRQNLLATHGRTIHSGQKRTWRDQIAMSALPPKADIRRLFDHLVEGRHRKRSPGLRHSTRFAGQAVREIRQPRNRTKNPKELMAQNAALNRFDVVGCSKRAAIQTRNRSGG